MFSSVPPLALYVHLPWCVRKCPYCDFNSHTLRQEIPEHEYINALIADLDTDLAEMTARPLVSIFIGGGTPSLFSPAAIAQLLTAIEQRLSFTPEIEITLEANPGSVEQERFVGYRAAGVNRLSIGVQSFQPEKLIALGRVHGKAEAIRAIEAAHAAGFINFNVDLMHGLPNQTVAEALADLETAIAFSPSHLSWYQLTIEPNTLFAHNPPLLPVEEILWDIQEQGSELLAAHNFSQYEISAYSQAGKQCVHNRNYWEFGDYLGIGAGAHGKITHSEKQTIIRHWKKKNPKEYLAAVARGDFRGGEHIVAETELPFEFMLNALRLYQEIPLSLFVERTGLSLATISAALNGAQDKNLLRCDDKVIQLTELGRRFYSDLVTIFAE